MCGSDSIRLLFNLSVILCPAVLADTTLDPTFFPTISIPEPGRNPAVIVQGNWKNDDSILPGDQTPVKDEAKLTGWLPARLFGETTATELKVMVTRSGASSMLPLTLRNRQDKDPAVFLKKDSMQTFEAHNAVIGKLGPNGKRRWMWEGFFYVNNEGVSNEEKPVVITLSLEESGTITKNYDLLLGECWLIAGGPTVGEQVSVSELGKLGPSAARDDGSASSTGSTPRRSSFATVPLPVAAAAKPIDAQTRVAQGAGAPTLIPPTTVGPIPGDTTATIPSESTRQSAAGSGLSPTAKVPAMAASFAISLAEYIKGTGSSCRPVLVSTCWAGRKMISDWSPNNGPLWHGVLSDLPDTRPAPGVRGVLWRHGDWEAARAHGISSVERPHEVNLATFQDAYVEAGTTLHQQVLEKLSRFGGVTAQDEEVRKRLLWGVTQLSDAGRKPEFHDVFAGDALSTWASLRVAQFQIVNDLRNLTWFDRPRVMLVPLGGNGPGYIDRADEPRGRVALAEAGRRMARAVYISLTEEATNEKWKYRDGWPHVNWEEKPAKLYFAGVKFIHLTPGIAEPGVGPPLLEARVKGNWTTVSFAGPPPYELPLDTTEVRYAWADATSSLHQLVFDSVPEWPIGAKDPRMPAFHLKSPQSLDAP